MEYLPLTHICNNLTLTIITINTTTVKVNNIRIFSVQSVLVELIMMKSNLLQSGGLAPNCQLLLAGRTTLVTGGWVKVQATLV